VTTEQLHVRYPKLFAKLEEKDLLLRHLVVVDENEKDVTDDDIMDELYDPETYTHVAYLHPPVVSALGDQLREMPSRLKQREEVSECFDSEGDLWGVITTLDTDALTLLILDEIEQALGSEDGA